MLATDDQQVRSIATPLASGVAARGRTAGSAGDEGVLATAGHKAMLHDAASRYDLSPDLSGRLAPAGLLHMATEHTRRQPPNSAPPGTSRYITAMAFAETVQQAAKTGIYAITASGTGCAAALDAERFIASFLER